MRLLVDVHSYEWQHAWRLTTATLSTPTTPCCPRRWDLAGGADGQLLPRHMQIIYLINAYHLDNLRSAASTTPSCCVQYR